MPTISDITKQLNTLLKLYKQVPATEKECKSEDGRKPVKIEKILVKIDELTLSDAARTSQATIQNLGGKPKVLPAIELILAKLHSATAGDTVEISTGDPLSTLNDDVYTGAKNIIQKALDSKINAELGRRQKFIMSLNKLLKESPLSEEIDSLPDMATNPSQKRLLNLIARNEPTEADCRDDKDKKDDESGERVLLNKTEAGYVFATEDFDGDGNPAGNEAAVRTFIADKINAKLDLEKRIKAARTEVGRAAGPLTAVSTDDPFLPLLYTQINLPEASDVNLTGLTVEIGIDGTSNLDVKALNAACGTAVEAAKAKDAAKKDIIDVVNVVNNIRRIFQDPANADVRTAMNNLIKSGGGKNSPDFTWVHDAAEAAGDTDEAAVIVQMTTSGRTIADGKEALENAAEMHRRVSEVLKLRALLPTETALHYAVVEGIKKLPTQRGTVVQLFGENSAIGKLNEFVVKKAIVHADIEKIYKETKGSKYPQQFNNLISIYTAAIHYLKANRSFSSEDRVMINASIERRNLTYLKNRQAFKNFLLAKEVPGNIAQTVYEGVHKPHEDDKNIRTKNPTFELVITPFVEAIEKVNRIKTVLDLRNQYGKELIAFLNVVTIDAATGGTAHHAQIEALRALITLPDDNTLGDGVVAAPLVSNDDFAAAVTGLKLMVDKIKAVYEFRAIIETTVPGKQVVYNAALTLLRNDSPAALVNTTQEGAFADLLATDRLALTPQQFVTTLFDNGGLLHALTIDQLKEFLQAPASTAPGPVLQAILARVDLANAQRFDALAALHDSVAARTAGDTENIPRLMNFLGDNSVSINMIKALSVPALPDTGTSHEKLFELSTPALDLGTISDADFTTGLNDVTAKVTAMIARVPMLQQLRTLCESFWGTEPNEILAKFAPITAEGADDSAVNTAFKALSTVLKQPVAEIFLTPEFRINDGMLDNTEFEANIIEPARRIIHIRNLRNIVNDADARKVLLEATIPDLRSTNLELANFLEHWIATDDEPTDFASVVGDKPGTRGTALNSGNNSDQFDGLYVDAVTELAVYKRANTLRELQTAAQGDLTENTRNSLLAKIAGGTTPLDSLFKAILVPGTTYAALKSLTTDPGAVIHTAQFDNIVNEAKNILRHAQLSELQAKISVITEDVTIKYATLIMANPAFVAIKNDSGLDFDTSGVPSADAWNFVITNPIPPALPVTLDVTAMSDAEFTKLKGQLTQIVNAAAETHHRLSRLHELQAQVFATDEGLAEFQAYTPATGSALAAIFDFVRVAADDLTNPLDARVLPAILNVASTAGPGTSEASFNESVDELRSLRETYRRTTSSSTRIPAVNEILKVCRDNLPHDLQAIEHLQFELKLDALYNDTGGTLTAESVELFKKVMTEVVQPRYTAALAGGTTRTEKTAAIIASLDGLVPTDPAHLAYVKEIPTALLADGSVRGPVLEVIPRIEAERRIDLVNPLIAQNKAAFTELGAKFTSALTEMLGTATPEVNALVNFITPASASTYPKDATGRAEVMKSTVPTGSMTVVDANQLHSLIENARRSAKVDALIAMYAGLAAEEKEWIEDVKPADSDLEEKLFKITTAETDDKGTIYTPAIEATTRVTPEQYFANQRQLFALAAEKISLRLDVAKLFRVYEVIEQVLTLRDAPATVKDALSAIFTDLERIVVYINDIENDTDPHTAVLGFTTQETALRAVYAAITKAERDLAALKVNAERGIFYLGFAGLEFPDILNARTATNKDLRERLDVLIPALEIPGADPGTTVKVDTVTRAYVKDVIEEFAPASTDGKPISVHKNYNFERSKTEGSPKQNIVDELNEEEETTYDTKQVAHAQVAAFMIGDMLAVKQTFDEYKPAHANDSPYAEYSKKLQDKDSTDRTVQRINAIRQAANNLTGKNYRIVLEADPVKRMEDFHKHPNEHLLIIGGPSSLAEAMYYRSAAIFREIDIVRKAGKGLFEGCRLPLKLASGTRTIDFSVCRTVKAALETLAKDFYTNAEKPTGAAQIDIMQKLCMHAIKQFVNELPEDKLNLISGYDIRSATLIGYVKNIWMLTDALHMLYRINEEIVDLGRRAEMTTGAGAFCHEFGITDAAQLKAADFNKEKLIELIPDGALKYILQHPGFDPATLYTSGKGVHKQAYSDTKLAVDRIEIPAPRIISPGR